MQFKTYWLFLLLTCVIFSCSQDEYKIVTPQIIPQPLNQQITEGQFILSAKTELVYETEFSVAVNFLKDFIYPALEGFDGVSNKISFIKDESVTNPGGYSLQINPNKIEIRTNTAKGAFYAIQSLRQLLPAEFETGNPLDYKVAIPCLKIEDKPQFQYRGMHLDVSRHMYSVDFIKKYIDAMAMLKMNTFHWHLTDDQGWRIEIKKYPKLNEISAFRNETLIGHYSDQPHQFDGKRYGGYYTQAQVKEIVAYANARFVTVIPEIEMPGHSQAAIAAYPDLACTGESVKVATKWGVFEEIYCTKDETFNFLEDVLDEVLELFPSQYIHIGGDEAPKTRWKTCSDCQARIKTEGLKDEHELQNYFITRMEKYLNAKGRQIIGWDEILEGGLAPNATVMSWRGTSGAVEAAKSGHNVVMTPTSHSYFDYYQSDNDEEPLAIGGFLPLEKVYKFNPIPEELTVEESKYVLGAQGNVWTEYMPTEEKVEYMAFPRMIAMSEVGWTKPENKDYKNFHERLENFHERLNVLNINYANHLYEIEGNLISEEGAVTYDLKTLTEGKTIRYTLDGIEPNLESQLYTEQIPITESTILKAAVFNVEKQLGETFMQNINFHKAVGKKVTISKAPSKVYSGSGAQGLINGINGSDTRYGDKEWLGFWGEDIEITIDLEEETEINSIETRFYNGNGQWIYAPKEIEVAFDNQPSKVHKLSSDNLLIGFKSRHDGMKVKTIWIKIPNYGLIPDGKQGSGNNAWTFIDEIIIN
jgi:hexosaminidase